VKKKIIGILLLFILIAPAILTYNWLQYKKSMVRKDIKERIIAGLDKDELVLLKFSTVVAQSELNWKDSKEFEYKHQMYDLVEKIIEGDSILLWCWCDDEETKLEKQLKKLVANALGVDQQSRLKQKQLISYFKLLFCPSGVRNQESIPQIAENFYRFQTFDYTNPIWPPPTPPPVTIRQIEIFNAIS